MSTEDPDYSSSFKAFFDDLEYRKEQESVFQQRVRRILKVGQVNTLRSDPTMRGWILGSSCNKNEKFIADTGTSVVIIPRSVAEKNKLQSLRPCGTPRCLKPSFVRKKKMKSWLL